MTERVLQIYKVGGVPQGLTGIGGCNPNSHGQRRFLLNLRYIIFSKFWDLFNQIISLKTHLEQIKYLDYYLLRIITAKNGVAIIQEGEAEGKNGEYDNKYVWIFKIKDGLIHYICMS